MTVNFERAREINKEVNSRIIALSDFDNYGKDEYWEIVESVGYEDCDGYSLTKRKMLLDEGANPHDVVMVACKLPSGEGHAVIAVNTDKGWWIMDNLHSDVVLPSDTGYKWISGMRDGIWYELHF